MFISEFQKSHHCCKMSQQWHWRKHFT